MLTLKTKPIMSTNKLYFYSFPANYEDQIALGRTPMLKIGETHQDSAEVRIRQQMGTATAQTYRIYGEFEVEFTDKQFHAFLLSRGYKQTDGAGTEWFEITAQEAEKLVCEFASLKNGIATPIRQQLALRPYQQDFIQKFITTQGDFCLFAKCRSGKSVMSLSAATEAGYRSMLVVSYRTSAGNSWLQDVETYTAFHEWDAINLSDADWGQQVVDSQQANRRQLLFSTVQRQRETLGYSKDLRNLYPQGIDLLALDECHIGGNSEEFERMKAAFTYRRLLEISGTAYKTIWRYPQDNIFVWGYVEEQKAKASGYEWAQVLPKMQLVFATYNAENLSEVYGNDPDALKNVFSVEGEKWKDGASVQAFLRKFFPYGNMVRKQKQLLHDSRHIVMSLPSVKACYLFADSLKEFGSQFAPLVITGDSGNSQKEILDHIAANPATICLTRWANVVGVTVPQWDTVIHGCEYESAEFWVQFAFRGGSTRRESWKVIDFAPERAVCSLVEMGVATASVSPEEDDNGVLRTFVDFADVFEFAEGYRLLDYGDILQLGDIGVQSAKAVINAAVNATRVGSNAAGLAWGFEDVDKIQDKTQLRESLNGNYTNSEGNARNANGRGETDPQQKIIQETLKKVKGAVEKLDDVVVAGLLNGHHLSTLPKLLAYEKFEMHTRCHPDVFEDAIRFGWVNERVINRSVSQAHLILDAQLSEVL